MEAVKLKIILVYSLTFFTCCLAQDKCSLEIGEKLKTNQLLKKSTFLMTSAGQINQCYSVSINGIEFVCSLDSDDKIYYIQTKDLSFQTIEKVRIGMPLKKVVEVSRNKIELERGWAFVLPLNSGWNAAFEISKNDENIMGSDSTVKWIYKRK